MTGQDATRLLDELKIAKYLGRSKELHALSDVEKLGFELDNILPLGTTGWEFLMLKPFHLESNWLRFSTGTKLLASTMAF